MLLTGRWKPWPSSGARMYSTGKPRSRSAITICSDSAFLTRGSLAPCTTSSGVLILAAELSGDWRIELGLALGRLRVAHPLVEDDAAGLPVRRDRVEQRDQVRRRHDRDGGAVDVGREGDAGERRVAAVRAAHDADALRVGDALGDQVLHAPGDVVLHLVAPLLVAGVEELLAVAGRAAEVRLQHRVAAIGEELREVVEAPAVARPRAAVRQHDRRQVLRRDALGQRQERRDLEPVRGRVAHGLHGRHVLARDALAHLVLQRQLLACCGRRGSARRDRCRRSR